MTVRNVLRISCLTALLLPSVALAQEGPNYPQRNGIVSVRALADGTIQVSEHSFVDRYFDAASDNAAADTDNRAQDFDTLLRDLNIKNDCGESCTAPSTYTFDPALAQQPGDADLLQAIQSFIDQGGR